MNIRICVLTFAAGLCCTPAFAADVIRYTPGMKPELLRVQPDSAMLVFPNGKQMSLGELRRLTTLGKQMRSTARKPLPPALAARAAARGTRVSSADDLRAALARPDSDTIELPSGRRMTVSQLKFVMPQVERALGRPLGAAGAGNDRVIQVDTRSDWKTILQMPDATLLQTPNGTRVTVGDIKSELRKESTPRLGTTR